MRQIKGAMIVLSGVLGDDLPDINRMSNGQIAAVLFAYAKIFSPNFVVWLTMTWTRCRTETAQEICHKNLQLEVDGKHPMMLRDLVAPLERQEFELAERAARRAEQKLARTIDALHDWCYTDSVPGLVTLAVLENLSLKFVFWLEQAAERLSLPDRTYLTVHGEADMEHAEALCFAVEQEIGHSRYTAEQYIDGEEVRAVMDLLHGIFHAYEQEETFATLAPA